MSIFTHSSPVASRRPFLDESRELKFTVKHQKGLIESNDFPLINNTKLQKQIFHFDIFPLISSSFFFLVRFLYFPIQSINQIKSKCDFYYFYFLVFSPLLLLLYFKDYINNNPLELIFPHFFLFCSVHDLKHRVENKKKVQLRNMVIE